MEFSDYQCPVCKQSFKNGGQGAVLTAFKEIPHNSGVRIAQQDFSSGCTNKLR